MRAAFAWTLVAAVLAAACQRAPRAAGVDPGEGFDAKTGAWTEAAAALAPGAAREFLAVIACPAETAPAEAMLTWKERRLGLPWRMKRLLALRCDGRAHAYRLRLEEAVAMPVLRFEQPAERAPEVLYAGLVPIAEGALYIPPGNRAIGSAGDDPMRGRLEPIRTQKAVPGFWIDRYEYPNIEGSLPTTLVGYAEASELCQAEGKRLCGQQEWEAACAGPEGSAFATGDAFDAEACGITGEDDALPRAYASGARPGCASGWGVLDLGGNVSELVADRMPVSFLDGRGFPWLRGANWSTGEASARCAARDHFHYGSLNGNEAFHNDGFRCCADRAVAGRKAVPVAAPPEAEPREDWLRHKGLFMHIRDKSLSADVQAMVAGLAPAADPREGMAEVPEGPFPMGSFWSDPDRSEIEWRTRAVHVPTFWIDRYEFPNRKGEKPVTGVTWYESRALCEAVGKRLCTEEEWEKACKGPEGSAYPYGHAFDPRVCDGGRAPYDLEDKAPSGSKPGCVSGYGAFDLSGSVNEWTASGYGVAYAEEVYRMLRGGDWGGSRRDLRCASRTHYHDPTQWYPDDGLRCCWSPPPASGESPSPAP